LYDDIADHFPILLELATTLLDHAACGLARNYRTYDAQSLELFSQSLAGYDWTSLCARCLVEEDGNELYATFLKVFIGFYDHAFLLKFSNGRSMIKNNKVTSWNDIPLN